MAWLVEFLDLAHLLYDATAGFDWGRVLLRTLVIVAIWVFVHFTTRPLLKRLHYLEDFLRICSWCRKVGHDGEWLTMEQYFGAKFKTETSHGICPDCARAQIDKFSAARVAKK
jgi:hypothetical protein